MFDMISRLITTYSMKQHVVSHSFLCAIAIGVFATLGWQAFSQAQAQTPPPGLVFELPMVEIHGTSPLPTGGYESLPITVDVNGDGLLDILMSDHNSQNNRWRQYVYTNNGNGWDKVYYCNRDDSGPWVGDCDYRN